MVLTESHPHDFHCVDLLRMLLQLRCCLCLCLQQSIPCLCLPFMHVISGAPFGRMKVDEFCVEMRVGDVPLSCNFFVLTSRCIMHYHAAMYSNPEEQIQDPGGSILQCGFMEAFSRVVILQPCANMKAQSNPSILRHKIWSRRVPVVKMLQTRH